jgi:site-specific recombinase XerD
VPTVIGNGEAPHGVVDLSRAWFNGVRRRSEVVTLDLGVDVLEFGLRRVHGKDGDEAAAPLPEVARAIVSDYLAQQQARAGRHQQPSRPNGFPRFGRVE